VTTPVSLAALALHLGAALGVWLALSPLGIQIGLCLVWGGAMGALCSRRLGTVLVVLLALGFVAGGAVLALGRRMAALEMPLVVWFITQLGADDGRGGPVCLEGRLRRDASPREFGVVLELVVVWVGQGEAQRPVAGRVRLSVGGAEPGCS